MSGQRPTWRFVYWLIGITGSLAVTVSFVLSVRGANRLRSFEALQATDLARIESSVRTAVGSWQAVTTDPTLMYALLCSIRSAESVEPVFPPDFLIAARLSIEDLDENRYEVDLLGNDWGGPWFFGFGGVKYGRIDNASLVVELIGPQHRDGR
jgi:hypothetical protein